MILWDPTNPDAAYYHYRAVHARAQAIDAGAAWLAAVLVRTVRRAGRAVARRGRRAASPAPVPRCPDGVAAAG